MRFLAGFVWENNIFEWKLYLTGCIILQEIVLTERGNDNALFNRNV